jgi:hypothetical protein
MVRPEPTARVAVPARAHVVGQAVDERSCPGFRGAKSIVRVRHVEPRAPHAIVGQEHLHPVRPGPAGGLCPLTRLGRSCQATALGLGTLGHSFDIHASDRNLRGRDPSRVIDVRSRPLYDVDMSADVTIKSIATTLAEERRELRAVLASLADLPAVLRELARAVTSTVQAAPEPEPEPSEPGEFMRAHRERAACAVLLELCDELGIDRHRRLSDGGKVEDLPAVELRHEIVAMLRASANTDAVARCRAVLNVSSDAGWMGRTVTACRDVVAASWELLERAERAEADLRALFHDLGCERADVAGLPVDELRPALVETLRARAAETVAHTCDAEHALVRAQTALRGGLSRLERPWAPEDDVESLVTQLLLACSLARPVDGSAYVALAGSLGLPVKLDGLDGADARAALVQAIRDRALADRQADVILGQDSVIDSIAAALDVPGRIDCETAADWAVRIAAQLDERPTSVTADVILTLTMERDDAQAQLRATDDVLRRAVKAAEIEPEGLTTPELAQRLAEIAAIRERTLEEADDASDNDAEEFMQIDLVLRAALQNAGIEHEGMSVLDLVHRVAALACDRNAILDAIMPAVDAARDTLVQVEQTLRTGLQAAGESTDGALVLDLAQRLAARTTDLPRSARDGARREQRELVAALAIDVRIDHLSVPGARAEIVRAVQSTTDAAGDRAAELLRDVSRVLRIVTPDLPEHVSVIELAHDVAERARRATDGTPDYKRQIDEARRTDDGAVWAVWSACQSLGVELSENATISEACDALGARIDSLAVWVRDSLPLARLWDRQLVDLCPLDVPVLDKPRICAATLGSTDDDAEHWKDLAKDVRNVADGDDIDGLATWIAEDKDARTVLSALLDRVWHLEVALQDKDDVDPRTETPFAEKLAQRMFEYWPAVEISTVQRSIEDLARVDDPLVRGVCALLTDKVQRAQRRRDLEDWCALTPSVRNRLIDRTQEALDAVAS